MALTQEEVLHVAGLARLSLKPEEIESFTRQLNDILEYMAKLEQVDTEAWPMPRSARKGPLWCPG